MRRTTISDSVPLVHEGMRLSIYRLSGFWSSRTVIPYPGVLYSGVFVGCRFCIYENDSYPIILFLQWLSREMGDVIILP
jgi:hypothetical protein